VDPVTTTGGGENAIAVDSAGCIIAALTAIGDSVTAGGDEDDAVVAGGAGCIIAGSTARFTYPLPLQLRHNIGGPKNAIAYDRCGAGER